MARKEKEQPKEEGKDSMTVTSSPLVPIAELLKQETNILGERSQPKLPRDAQFSGEYLEIATRLVAAGLTESDLAYVLGTTKARIKFWKRKNPLFKKACTDGKGVAKSYLIAQGLKAAAGYSTEEKNIKMKTRVNKEGVLEEYIAETSTFIKHVKPDAALLVFMLCNLSRQQKDDVPWQSQHKIEVSEDKKISIKISGKIATEQISKLAGAFLPTIEGEVVDAENKHDDEKPRGLPEGDSSGHPS